MNTSAPEIFAVPQKVKEHTLPSFYANQSVSKFLDTPIDEAAWKAILDAIYWSPTSQGFEPYRVLIVTRETSNDLLKKLAEITNAPKRFGNADKVLIFVALPRKIFNTATWIKQRAMRKVLTYTDLRGEPAAAAAEAETQRALTILFGKSHTEGDEWALKQAHVGLAFALSAATLANVDYMRVDNLARRALEAFLMAYDFLNDGERVALVCAFGNAPKQRLTTSGALRTLVAAIRDI